MFLAPNDLETILWSHRKWILEKLDRGYADELGIFEEINFRVNSHKRLIWDQAGMNFYTGFTRLCKGLAVVLIGGHIVVQILPSAVSYLALIPTKTIPFAWNLLTPGYIEQSIYGVFGYKYNRSFHREAAWSVGHKSVASFLKSLSLGWGGAFFILQISYFFIHYLFAGQTAHVGALYSAFLGMYLASNVPGLLAALALSYNTNLFGAMVKLLFIMRGGLGPIVKDCKNYIAEKELQDEIYLEDELALLRVQGIWKENMKEIQVYPV
ncbi:hypothetical protein CASFOL_001842 [Castilleja foliolosa]|uniref:ABC transmembrane type-1 domain-containing protein n=1 Tax=Castilleja foliolosa TaxID=1961234 RepID=A0ABD3ECP7_9LAMI